MYKYHSSSRKNQKSLENIWKLPIKIFILDCSHRAKGSEGSAYDFSDRVNDSLSDEYGLDVQVPLEF